MPNISIRNLFLVEFLIFLSFYLVEIKYLGQAPSELCMAVIFGFLASILHLNFRIFVSAEIPLFAGLFYLFYWPGLYFFICTSCFGKWANMYILAFALFICLGQGLMGDYYPWYFKWKNVQEKNLYALAIVSIVFMMILGFFAPPILIIVPPFLGILVLFYYFILFVL